MTSLRGKLTLGFGGLLAILLAVSILSIIVLTRYSHALDRVFRENYDSAVYCHQMNESLDGLNTRAERRIWRGADEGNETDSAAEARRFQTNLDLQLRNCTLPGELALTRQLATAWNQYQAAYARFDSAGNARAELYLQDLLPRFQALKRITQRVADMNMSNMVSVDGSAKRVLLGVRRALLIMVIIAIILAASLVGAVGATVLRPLRILTQSAGQIASGNLELNMPVRSADEIGRLTQAFNSMASRLREFRRLDGDRLARTQQTTQLAIDSLPDPVVVIGVHGQIEIANRAAQSHFGIVSGARVAEMKLKWLNEIVSQVSESARPSEPQGYGAAIQLFDAGKERFLLPRGVPMFDPGGQPIGVAVILVDVTQLRHADEMKSDLVSTVSHELRTPLTALRMALSLLKENKVGELTGRQRTLVKAAHDESERLYRIIENLLNISRIESGRAHFELRRLSAGEIVDAAVEPARDDFARKQVHFQTELDPMLPDVVGDATFVGYALANLLSNAMKFTPAGGRVSISVKRGRDEVEFIVADTGPGIPREYADRVFQKFFRVPSSEGPSGVGLGLVIAKEIVEAQGGRIWFRDRDGGGCEFGFTLPAIERAAETASP